MRALMVRLKPTVFEDIIALVALYRPGPMESGMHDDFVRRKHGESKVEYFLPQMEPILKETYGVILYQEQVMQIAAAVSGFSLAEADLLRRAMGKKDPAVMAAQRDRFVSGAVAKGVPKAKAGELFTLIEKFAGYGFNKSHSAAYALVAYQTAYLKAHYPLEFLAAVLNSEINNTAAMAKHIMEAREQGIVLLPPDINRSDRDFTVEDGKVRFGLAGVKNVGVGAIHDIIEARQAGPFENFRDVLERINLGKVNRKVLEALIQAGAFDSLQPRRSRLMAGLEGALEKVNHQKRLQATKQMSMFGGLLEPQEDDWLPEAQPWDKSVKLAREKEALGVYVTGHPLDAYRALLKAQFRTTTADLAEAPDSQEVALGVVVTSLKEKVSKRGGRLAILTVEDLAGSVEALVFTEVYERVASLLPSPACLCGSKGTWCRKKRAPNWWPRRLPPWRPPGALAGETGPAPPGRHRDPGATAAIKRDHGPASGSGARLPALSPAPERHDPGPPQGTGPEPVPPIDCGSQPPLRIPGADAVTFRLNGMGTAVNPGDEKSPLPPFSKGGKSPQLRLLRLIQNDA